MLNFDIIYISKFKGKLRLFYPVGLNTRLLIIIKKKLPNLSQGKI